MIQFAEQPMRPALAAMWRECFGDGNEYVDLYFSNFDITRHTMVFMDGDHPASMLSLLPMTVVTRAGILPARYIYAVATLPSYQGRGLSTKLLEAAHKRMQQAGVKLSVLVPASPKLYNFYGKRGFRTEFYMGVTEVAAGQIPPYRDSFAISEAGCADFMEIRERAFGGRTMFARWDGEALAYRRYRRTAPPGVYRACVALERRLREMGIGRAPPRPRRGDQYAAGTGDR